jgi:membrane carboxypeptidase/penicillin-binding protein PbpC
LTNGKRMCLGAGIAKGRRKASLHGETDADSRQVCWFIDEKFLETAKSGETLFWKPRPGTFVVRVVDDHGRADARDIAVQVIE